MTKKLDPDIKALRGAARALQCSTPRMLRANLEFLWDHFIEPPPKDTTVREEKP